MDYTIICLYLVVLFAPLAGDNIWSAITAIVALVGLMGTVIGLYIKARIDMAKIKLVQQGITHDLIELNEKIDGKMDSITAEKQLEEINRKLDKLFEKQDKSMDEIIKLYKELSKKAG